MGKPAHTLVVNELYASLQGESSYMGRPCVFLRLTGCHLRCRWCDSEYNFYEGERLSLETVLTRIQGYGLPLVLVTGGEPLLQKHTPELLRRLADDGYEVLLETSGNLPWHEIDARISAIVDVKCPGSGESEKNRLELLANLRDRDEIQFVVADRTDYEYARDVIERYGLGPSGRVLVSPVWGAVEPSELAEWILNDRLPVRMQVQLHKILWGKETRGV